MTTFVFAQGKGGATKTTSAAEAVALLGEATLVLDCDQQGDLAARLGITATPAYGSADLLTGDATEDEAIIPSRLEGIDVAVGTDRLLEVESMPECASALQDLLPDLVGEGKRWRHCVIDTPPGLGVVALAALAAADVVVAPVMCSGEGMNQLRRLEAFIERRVARRMHPGQAISWIMPTRYDARRSIDREVVEILQETYPGRVTTPVRQGVVAVESYVAGLPVGLYAPRSGVARDYAAAFAPILPTEEMS